MWLLEIVILFGSAFCFVVSNYETTHSNYEDPNPEKEDCSSNHESDCFCYDGPGDHQEYSICVDQPESISPCLSDRRTPHQGPGYLISLWLARLTILSNLVSAVFTLTEL